MLPVCDMVYTEPTKIICVGRNYAQHAKELNNAVPDEPMFFLKPPSSVIHDGQDIVLPRGAGRVDFEAELGVVIADRVRGVSEAGAMEHVLGYLVCNDVTARDLQEKAKRTGYPWSVSKGFDTFFPISPIRMAADAGDPSSLDIELRLNGELKQKGNTSDMIFPIPRLISAASSFMTLERGDVIATGTPAGISQLHAGDRVEIAVESVGSLTNGVVEG